MYTCFLHLTTCPVMIVWSSISMVTTQRVPKIWHLYVPRCTKEFSKRNFVYKGSMLWNDLPYIFKESSSLDVFKSNVSSLVDKSLRIDGYFCLSIYILFKSFSYFDYVSTFYWGTYVYLKSWCSYFIFRVLYKMFLVLYFRIIYHIFYGITFFLCQYWICLVKSWDNI